MQYQTRVESDQMPHKCRQGCSRPGIEIPVWEACGWLSCGQENSPTSSGRSAKHPRRVFQCPALSGLLCLLASLSAAHAAPLPVQSSFVGNDSAVVPAGISERKAATKAWFKRKGQQTSNWFQRQKRKLENLVD